MYGLISSTGVPSQRSMPDKKSLSPDKKILCGNELDCVLNTSLHANLVNAYIPSIRSNLTKDSPIGLGLCGDLVAYTPSDAPSIRGGCTFALHFLVSFLSKWNTILHNKFYTLLVSLTCIYDMQSVVTCILY